MSAAISLGFTRGVSPSKWARRWSQAVPGEQLELVPFEAPFGRPQGRAEDARDPDVILERAAPGERPEGSDPEDPERTRHALRLYEEAIALVVPAEHELGELTSIPSSELALIRILDHPGHFPAWPDPAPWDDPEWAPRSIRGALDLVATGLGGILMPLPLAKHLAEKRQHAVLPVVHDDGSAPLPGSTIWASWSIERDAPDVQQLAGILRGRTSRSSRSTMREEPQSSDAETKRGTPRAKQQASAKQQTQAKRTQLPKNSRGAQLAAARERAERAKAAKRKSGKKRR